MPDDAEEECDGIVDFDGPLICNSRSSLIMIIAGLGLLLLGCVIPVLETESFPEEVTSAIVPGKSTRKDVLTTLGAPLAVRRDQSLFSYSEQQILAVLLVAGPGQIGGVPLGPTQSFLVPFAPNGTVQRTASVERAGDYCRADGTCLLHIQMLDSWAAPPADKAAAAANRPVPGQCAIYLIQGSLSEHMASDDFERIMFDGHKVLQFQRRAPALSYPHYHYSVTPPGQHRLEHVGESDPFYLARPFTFHCNAGDVIYIKRTMQVIERKKGYIISKPTKVAISFAMKIEILGGVDAQLGHLLAP